MSSADGDDREIYAIPLLPDQARAWFHRLGDEITDTECDSCRYTFPTGVGT